MNARETKYSRQDSPIPPLVKDASLVGGNWIASSEGLSFSVFNPATGSKIADVPNMGEKDVVRAIDAADAAFLKWRSLLPSDRAKILTRWANLIEAQADDLAMLMTCEQGKPLSEARAEILAGAGTIQWCAEEGRRLYGEFLEGPKSGSKIIVSRHPVGVIGAITPWNFPASMITRKVGPALAAGCTVVLKPAEATPLTALALGALAQEAGLPDGVLNILTSARASEVGKTLTSDPRIKKISFTGSTEVGKILMSQAAQHIQKISLELGGNAPFLIFPSTDLEKAAAGVISSKFRNAGQTCICANRIFVHADIMQEFTDIVLDKIKKMKVGAGWEQDVAIGPLIEERAIEKVKRLVADAAQSGAKILTGGSVHALGGTFYEPTLITGLKDEAPIAREEIFGPVACLYSFEDESDVIRRANDTPYGLAAYLYSADLAQVWRVSDGLHYGMVGVNEPLLATDLAPFGGVKESGIGREGGKYGLLEYTDIKYRLFGA